MDLLFTSWLAPVVLAVIVGAHIWVALVVRRMVRRDVSAHEQEESSVAAPADHTSE